MPDQPILTALCHVPDWSVIVLSDEPSALGVVTNTRPRGKVLVKTSRNAEQFLSADHLARVWKYHAELAHDCLDTHQTAPVDVSSPTHVDAMLHGSDRDRTWTGNPAMRAIAGFLNACGVKRRGLLNNEHVLVLERRYRSFELSDNGGEINIFCDGQPTTSVPLTRWSAALRVDTVVYRILCVLNGTSIDYDYDPPRSGEEALVPGDE